ncbi:MAG: hypothetical protein A3A97_02695 [Candidatus Terrybacteria bacterium RIFCSPLOWO2_01_FULL_40_23]|uniref:Uncharacterized protein n=1 Tax=Candidatus Terrybacteria bacterium RIFCSPLOWO2_01_FULL_40_23 TaxID=1802366 RepID=A0A1G2PRT1_9BACT|nr:MAG: hypothetical protein A3A97_02695 [Candidatus Terrybacteria bacterium RIFCSPLOWO2_01_FULL_40_23]
MFSKKKLKPIIFLSLALVIGVYFYAWDANNIQHNTSETLAAKFEYLSKNGNSVCSTDFTKSIENGLQDKNIQGSCCGPMDFHRYIEQIEGLKKYYKYSIIPPDPYDIDSQLAKELAAHYDDALTLKHQKAYDYAMENSHEKGPCCCKCWHWYVYGGLAKLLIQQYNFSGEQIVDVWDLSDGCGGAGEHAQ